MAIANNLVPFVKYAVTIHYILNVRYTLTIHEWSLDTNRRQTSKLSLERFGYNIETSQFTALNSNCEMLIFLVPFVKYAGTIHYMSNK